MRTILLGPQRRPTVDRVLASLGLSGPVATVTAGWLEGEGDDAELSTLLGGSCLELALYRRWLDVQDRDPGYAAAERGLAGVLAELQEVYLLRLDYALQAVYALQRRSSGDPLRAGAVEEALAAVRELDAAHLRRVEEVRGEFLGGLRPRERPVIAEHRSAVTGALGQSAAVVIAGGHVGVLAGVLRLFGALDPPPSLVIAWSAGAMALTDRVVLFGDRSPQGPGHAEVWGTGLGVAGSLVLLPHARARLLLDDAPRMAVFARRFAPARCVLLENGTRLDAVAGGGAFSLDGARVLGLDGHVVSAEAA
jgi:hypothetical protein